MPNTLTEPNSWSAVREELASSFSAEVFQMWFEPLRCLHQDDESVKLAAANDFARIWIQDNYLDLITEKFRLLVGHPVEVSLVADPEGAAAANKASGTNRMPERAPAREVPREKRAAQTARQNAGAYLNQRNVFETFVVGSNNQLAHAACVAVAQAPATAYNPLFLYGDTGLGKTHLMQSVGHHVLRQRGDARVAYISSEKFTNEYITAIQENNLTRFRKRYRSADILLIDDIHFLSGKERIQEEFFHTFNDLFESQKQIILSSDRPASEIQKLENRLVSRFQWGLVVDIQAPDFETRSAILRSKCKTLDCDLEPEVLDFIAERVTRNIRRLEGALIKIASVASLQKVRIDVDTASALLQDVLQEEAQQQVTIEMIQKRVCEHFRLCSADMTSKSRPAKIAFPRQIAMYLARNLTGCSLKEIASSFKRDHGTVIYACRTVENIMEQDESIRNVVERLKKSIEKFS